MDAKDKTLEDSLANDQMQKAVSESKQIEYLVKQIAADVDKLSDKIKEQRKMLKDSMHSDSRFQQLTEKIKEINNQRKSIQKELSDLDAVRKAKEELEDLNSERKALQYKLSGYLSQYVEKFSSRTIEDLEGNLKQITTQHKLVRRKTD